VLLGAPPLTLLSLSQGHLDLVFNWHCSAKSAGIDTSNTVVFVTDEGTKKQLEAAGLTAFYHPAFGDLPAESANAYGDSTFVSMMWLKVTSVWACSHFKYDVLFQDADLVWYKDPFEYFKNAPADIDTFWQDDGARSIRYAPFFANSGFYYLRSNDRTRNFMHELLLQWDQIMSLRSHQHALDQLLIQHRVQYGMTVKVLEKEEFPQGQIFHHRKETMIDFVEGRKHPHVFHMCWTASEVNKLKYMKQVGMWYLKPECTEDAINKGGGAFLSQCCNPAAGAWKPLPEFTTAVTAKEMVASSF
jgi:hypothetical protein